MEFGYGNNETVDTTVVDKQDEIVDDKEKDDTSLVSPDDSTTNLNDNEQTEETNTENDSFDHGLEKGSTIEFDNKTYTISENGDLIDDKGEIFKKVDEVKDWISQYESSDTNNELNIENIQKLFDIEITDEEGKTVEFENTFDGIKAYTEAVIAASREEAQENAINMLYDKLPILRDLIPYCIANGGSIDGFNDAIKDYSGIEIDDENEAQQISIIKTSWEEQGKRGNVEKYINFLKAEGTLADAAREELEALKEANEAYREKIAREAEEKENAEIERRNNYWNGVKKVIDSRNIAGYKIPETIIVNNDGKRSVYSPNDFFNYIFQVDEKGHSRYEYDRAKETPEERRDDEILRAYLKFTGGNYTNLIDMAINDKQVAKLKLTAKTRRTTTTLKINNKSGNNNKHNFGYN